MKNILKILFLLIIGCFKSFGQISNTKSYQVSIDFKEPTTSNTQTVPNENIAITNVVYFDGLGRPIQQNKIKSSSTGKDISKHIEYNLNGDLTKDYLPIPTNQSGGAYIENLIDHTNNFYNTPEYGNTTNPYAEKILEKSPERKVLAQGFPGNDWNPNELDNHALKYEYRINSSGDAVKKFKVTTIYNTSLKTYFPTIIYEGIFNENELYKNITKNENWVESDGQNNTTEEFKNKLGQVILIREYNNDQKHDTYYSYDIYGNLTYIIPPITNGEINNEILSSYCYQYVYDNKNRLVEKKLPQKEWEYIIYDNADRVVLTGPHINPFDDNLKGWYLNKYDALGRLIYNGFYEYNEFDSNVRYNLSQNTFIPEQKTNTNAIDNVWVTYTNNSFPTQFKLLNVNYYDDYSFPYAPTNFNDIENQPVNINVKGLLTGTRTRVITNRTENILKYSHFLYNNKNQITQSYLENQLGGYTQTNTKLNFSGIPIYSHTIHKKNENTTQINIYEEFTYNSNLQLNEHKHKINSLNEETISLLEYDELGKLITKKNSSWLNSNGLQKIKYKYNIRGWLTGINNLDDTQTDNDLFAYSLNYTGGISRGQVGYFNGNIASIMWKTATDDISRKYIYSYDHLSRLKSSFLFPSHEFKENISYDKNGNILELYRTGKDEDYQTREIDDLVYTYNGNQLFSVSDNINNPEGFRDGNTTGDDYTYDAMGNMTVDKNKGITKIKYNHLNLPTEVLFNTGKIEYIYDNNGERQSKKVIPNEGPIVTTDYINGFQYENGVLQFFPHPEGYVKRNDNNTFMYVYQYKDHLGNVRLSYADLDGDGEINPAEEILEENNYYPFGLKHKVYNDIVNSNRSEAAEKYKFGGKEWNDELGLDLYDFHARNYDPAIGRFMNVDPLAEKYPGWTPYHYVHNNPINLIDPTGMEADGWIKSLKDDKVTYTYDATITSQEQVNTHFPDGNKEYVGENFQLTGTNNKTNETAYQYNFQSKSVTDSNGQAVNLTNNFTTAGGSTIMNPENSGGAFSGITLGGAVGGGISLSVGFVTDSFGDKGLYFTFGGHAGLGGGAGISSGVISPTVGQSFGINDFRGMGNSVNLSVGIGAAGGGIEYGGTQGDGFSNFGNRTESTPRPYIYSGGGQSSQYPSTGIQVGKVSVGAMISSTRTWVLKL